MSPCRGPCLVYVEELGEKYCVPYKMLQPHPAGFEMQQRNRYNYRLGYTNGKNVKMTLTDQKFTTRRFSTTRSSNYMLTNTVFEGMRRKDSNKKTNDTPKSRLKTVVSDNFHFNYRYGRNSHNVKEEKVIHFSDYNDISNFKVRLIFLLIFHFIHVQFSFSV